MYIVPTIHSSVHKQKIVFLLDSSFFQHISPGLHKKTKILWKISEAEREKDWHEVGFTRQEQTDNRVRRIQLGKILTGSAGPQNSLKVLGVSVPRISRAMQGPEHSSVTIPWQHMQASRQVFSFCAKIKANISCRLLFAGEKAHDEMVGTHRIL